MRHKTYPFTITLPVRQWAVEKGAILKDVNGAPVKITSIRSVKMKGTHIEIVGMGYEVTEDAE